MQIHVVIPAHNEAAGITATIESVRAQTRPPHSVTVVADNCDDATSELAEAAGAGVFATVGNTHRKAGALNQYLDRLLPSLDADDVVLVMDADTRLSDSFLETATRLLGADEVLGAVGGVFVGAEPTSWLEHAQANEYARYARDIARHGGRVMVLTGTATAFRAQALRDVEAARGERLPGLPGTVYDVGALTEDNEMTLALKHLGWQLVSPKQCVVWTELMPTVGDLHRQRLRWYRGAVDNLRTYGLTRVTARYWGQQAMLALSVAVFGLLLLLTLAGVLTGTLRVSLMWSLVGLGFLLEGVVSSWRTGSRRGRLLSALLFPELFFDLVLQATFLRAVSHSLRGTTAAWHHVGAAETPAGPAQTPNGRHRADATPPVAQRVPQTQAHRITSTKELV